MKQKQSALFEDVRGDRRQGLLLDEPQAEEEREELLTEQNTPKVEQLVRRAATVKFGRGKARPYFAHGQWWAIVKGAEDAAMYSVVDAEPSIAETGLDFDEC